MIPSYSLAQVFGISISEQRKIYFNHRNTLISLLSNTLTEQQDALTCDWNSEGAIFCNPPYSKIMPWVKKAAEQHRRQNQTIVMLLPSDTSTSWFQEAIKTSHEARFITEGRLSFISAETGKEGKAGNSKGSVLFIWRPWRKLGCRITYVQRKELLKARR
ncbi:phage N-6-adenine-methyltransferase [Arsenophonus sp. ENCA]|uniref:phage N-6-adenine-methyltransferase n=1 Tax=Arsenophonus sp. ENCA TaxID=1987579 RepID=UPI000BC65702|nr:phage N-6-adenine-methyltransferase [Arsenophonus sp. ENCA]PAV10909.1 phage N-6-adenine-methyltransferase [Arsenophonus sp. ENCA]